MRCRPLWPWPKCRAGALSGRTGEKLVGRAGPGLGAARSCRDRQSCFRGPRRRRLHRNGGGGGGAGGGGIPKRYGGGRDLGRPLSKNNSRDGDFLDRVECYGVFERCCTWIGHRGWLLLELLLELLLSVLLSRAFQLP
jgi:hypothetical protein